MSKYRSFPDNETLLSGLVAGDRALLSRAITLVESRNPGHVDQAQELVSSLPKVETSHRIGLSGVPGVGKSTFLEGLGTHLLDDDHRVAVLAVDPSSSRSGGSILGDKTRMPALSVSPDAFIRPSPTSGVLGGVARATRQAIALVEAAGFDTIFVETVGTGQSETMVANLVDFFLVLMLPGAGDDLQGIKKGILEIADAIAINKADQDPKLAQRAARDYRAALHIVTPSNQAWQPPVLTCSAFRNEGLKEIWHEIQRHRQEQEKSGDWQARRRLQRANAFDDEIDQQLKDRLFADPNARRELAELRQQVIDGSQPSVTSAAKTVLEKFWPVNKRGG